MLAGRWERPAAAGGLASDPTATDSRCRACRGDAGHGARNQGIANAAVGHGLAPCRRRISSLDGDAIPNDADTPLSGSRPESPTSAAPTFLGFASVNLEGIKGILAGLDGPDPARTTSQTEGTLVEIGVFKQVRRDRGAWPGAPSPLPARPKISQEHRSGRAFFTPLFDETSHLGGWRRGRVSR